jgi:IstB-like ATP binding protein
MATKQEETASSRREARLPRAERRQIADHGAPMTNKNTSHHNSGPNSKMPPLSEGQLEPLFRRLNLAHTRRIYQDLADRAEKENWSYRDFLALLLAEEVAHRKQTRLQRLTRKAHFPFLKTIDEFDSSLQSTLRQSLLGSYLVPNAAIRARQASVHPCAAERFNSACGGHRARERHPAHETATPHV